MKTNSHDRTAIGAILLGTVGALALATLVFAVARSPQKLSDAPVFTPYEVAPRMTNVREVQAALVREYPPLMKSANIGGEVTIRFFIDEEGKVRETMLGESSGHAQLDAAALAVAGIVEFTPAMNRNRSVPVWISLPITFVVR